MSSGIAIIEDAIYEYPALKAAYLALKRTSTTASSGERIGGGSSRRDPTAIAAMRELPPDDQRRYAAVRSAIFRMRYWRDSATRLMLVDLVYWKRTHSVEEAAEVASCSKSTAMRYQQEFITCVKELMGLSDCKGCSHWRKILDKANACHYCYDVGHMRTYELGSCYSKCTDRLIDGKPHYGSVV